MRRGVESGGSSDLSPQSRIWLVPLSMRSMVVGGVVCFVVCVCMRVVLNFSLIGYHTHWGEFDIRIFCFVVVFCFDLVVFCCFSRYSFLELLHAVWFF